MAKSINLTTAVILFWLFSLCVNAQKKNSLDVVLHAEKELERTRQSNILSSVVKIENKNATPFVGKLNIDTPEGLRTIADSSPAIEIAANDSLFVPVKFLVNPGIESGDNYINYQLVNDDHEVAAAAKSLFRVLERIDLFLSVENRNMMITNATDSVNVYATVTNNGNKAQEVIVVFSIPTLKRGVNFVEQKHYLEPQEQYRFRMAFLPLRELIAENQFEVKIAGMYGKEKNLFGNSSINIQNVSNNRVYEDPGNYYGLSNSYSRNEISLSHRSTNNGSGISQINGSVDVDLPAGFLNFRGNIYKYGSSNNPTASSTSMSYILGENEYMVGNIYESLETSMSGRGVKARIGSAQRNNFVVGVVDQEYDLFSTNPLFDDTYSAFAKGEKVFYGKALQKIQGTAIYKRDGREQSHDVISGGELSWHWKKNWSANVRFHGAMSQSMFDQSRKPSGSAEMRFNGETQGFNLSGNYYLSSGYFPGNRKGVLSLQQSVSKRINEFSFNTNAYYSRFKPRSYVMPIHTNNGNFMGNADIYFPRLRNVTFGLGYQHQYEHSNNFQLNQPQRDEIEMSANRVRGSMSWSSRRMAQSASLWSEFGASSNTFSDNLSQQFRANLSYSVRWLNLMAQYQRGSYYLSEQLSSSHGGGVYERFISSLSINQHFFDNKLYVMANAGMSKDYFSDFSPSAYVNVRYNMSKWFSMFANSNWYSYKFKDMPLINTFSNEFGLTVHLNNRKANATKKSKVTTFVFHDRNSNGVYDAGDEPAKGYPVTINKRPFITNEKGEVTYRKVPFGKYELGQISEKGWFGDADTLKVNKFKTKVQIPLQQAGVVNGSIVYNFDSKTSMEIEPKAEGIIFQITSTDGIVKHRVSTNDDATFTAFLPTGEYRIELITISLPANTTCDDATQTVKVEPGKIVRLKPYVIDVQQKKINIKRFGE